LIKFLEFYFGLPDFAGAIYLEFAVKFKDGRRLQNKIRLCNLGIKFSGDFAEFYRGVNEALLCESSDFI